MWYNFLILIHILAWGKGKHNNNPNKLYNFHWFHLCNFMVAIAVSFTYTVKRVFAKRIIKLFGKHKEDWGIA